MNEGGSQTPAQRGLAWSYVHFPPRTDRVQPHPSYLLTSTHLLQEAVPDHTSPPGPVPRDPLSLWLPPPQTAGEGFYFSARL